MTDSYEQYEQIVYPDDLVEMWRFAHNEKNASFSLDIFENKWLALHNMLSGYIYNNNIPGINQNPREAQEAASDYLAYLLQGPCPDTILSHQFLISTVRKYLARKRNPVQYELNSILHIALRALEKEGKIIRAESDKEKRIHGHTHFALKEIVNPVQRIRDDYEMNKALVPSFGSRIRANDPLRTRILAPSDAKELVLYLLKAFNGWTFVGDLLWAMRFHIPEQLIPFSFSQAEKKEDEEKQSTIESVKDDTADEFIYGGDFDIQQIMMISEEASGKIWSRICKISDELFCLYFLPKEVYHQDVRMEKFGASSTVFDRNQKIREILAEEMKNYSSYFEVSEREKVCMKETVSKIFQKLQGRCTEKGYISNLSVPEGN